MEKFRTVPDTNVIIAGHKSKSETSPNKEYINLWLKAKIKLLYSDDTILEYIEKLKSQNIPDNIIEKFFIAIMELGEYVPIELFHFQKYPKDEDDIAFVLCAENGNATHLITYDTDLLNIKDYFKFKICKTIEFLNEFKDIQLRIYPKS